MAQIQALLSSPQTVTASWVDVGGEISADGHPDIGFFCKVTINNSNNVEFRVLAKHTKAHVDEYDIMIGTLSSGKYLVSASVYQLDSDADQKTFFHLALGAEIPFLQMQVKALTVGIAGATVDEIKYDLA